MWSCEPASCWEHGSGQYDSHHSRAINIKLLRNKMQISSPLGLRFVKILSGIRYSTKKKIRIYAKSHVYSVQAHTRQIESERSTYGFASTHNHSTELCIKHALRCVWNKVAAFRLPLGLIAWRDQALINHHRMAQQCLTECKLIYLYSKTHSISRGIYANAYLSKTVEWSLRFCFREATPLPKIRESIYSSAFVVI